MTKTFKGRTGFFPRPKEVAGVKVICLLFTIPDADAIWFGTKGGGACCFPVVGNQSAFFDCVTPKPSGPFLLKDAVAVADYVYHAVSQRLSSIGPACLVSDLVLRGLVALAIFPGYGSPVDESEPSGLAIDRLLAAFQMAGVKAPLSLLALHVLEWGRSALCGRHLPYVLAAYPSRYLGALAAHGLHSRPLWKSKYALAMSEGWAYQLQHPDAYYESPWLLELVYDVGRATIEDLSLTRRKKLLAASGFCEQQFSAARELAISQTGTDRGSAYLRSLVTSLTLRNTGLPSPTDDGD